MSFSSFLFSHATLYFYKHFYMNFSLDLLCLPSHPKKRSLRWKRELGPEIDPSSLLIVASPFSRTLETATLASAAVGIDGFENVAAAAAAHPDGCEPRFVADEALRERHFGGFELQSHDHYKTVWVEDARDVAWRAPPAAASEGEGEGKQQEGESVVDVARRLRGLFAELEAKYSDKNILLVSHGDTLSIATAVAKGGGLGRHREHAQETGELRKL